MPFELTIEEEVTSISCGLVTTVANYIDEEKITTSNLDNFSTEDYDASNKQDALINKIKNGTPDFSTDEFMCIDSKNQSQFLKADGYGDGCLMRTFVFGEQGVRMLCQMKKGHVEPPHYHKGRYEWYVISGKYLVRNPITGKEAIVKAGDYYYNPPNVPHTEEVLESGVLLWMYDRIPDCQCMTDKMVQQAEQIKHAKCCI